MMLHDKFGVGLTFLRKAQYNFGNNFLLFKDCHNTNKPNCENKD